MATTFKHIPLVYCDTLEDVKAKAGRVDGDLGDNGSSVFCRLGVGERAVLYIWYSNSEASDDGDNVLQPSSYLMGEVGRWIKVYTFTA